MRTCIACRFGSYEAVPGERVDVGEVLARVALATLCSCMDLTTETVLDHLCVDHTRELLARRCSLHAAMNGEEPS